MLQGNKPHVLQSQYSAQQENQTPCNEEPAHHSESQVHAKKKKKSESGVQLVVMYLCSLVLTSGLLKM